MRNDNTNNSITISAVGDICLGLAVRDEVEKHESDFLFAKVIEELNKSDIRMGNLEVVFPGSHISYKKGQSDLWAPDNAFAVVAGANFDVLNLSNNHIMDFGLEGLSNTIKLLDDNGILHVGAQSDLNRASKPAIMECNSLKIGFLSFADNEGQIAGRRRPGAAEARKKHVLRKIARLKKRVDIIVLSLHVGIEFIHYPSPFMVDLARSAVSAGADAVLCHHPHVLQGMEMFENSLICYSLGNFVFQVHGNDYQGEFMPYTAWSVIVKLDLSRDGYRSHEIIPVVIKADHRPWIADDREKRAIFEHIDSISKPLHDIRQVKSLYYAACLWYAKANYWNMSSLIRSRDIRSTINMIAAIISRAPGRRWIIGFLRYVLLRVSHILGIKKERCFQDKDT